MINGFTWGSFVWGDGSFWSTEYGSIKISSSRSWMVTSITKDMDNWSMLIKAEEII